MLSLAFQVKILSTSDDLKQTEMLQGYFLSNTPSHSQHTGSLSKLLLTASTFNRHLPNPSRKKHSKGLKVSQTQNSTKVLQFHRAAAFQRTCSGWPCFGRGWTGWSTEVPANPCHSV